MLRVWCGPSSIRGKLTFPSLTGVIDSLVFRDTNGKKFPYFPVVRVYQREGFHSCLVFLVLRHSFLQYAVQISFLFLWSESLVA